MRSPANDITAEKFKKLLQDLSNASKVNETNAVSEQNENTQSKNSSSSQLQNIIRQIPTYEIKEGTIIATTGYHIGALLGSGTYGKVFSATKDNKEFAVKVKKNITKQQKDDNLFERLIMKTITERGVSECLVGALGTFQHGPNFCYVMEKLDISLHDFQGMNEQNPFQIQVVLSISQQLCVAAFTLAKIGFLHLDIKPTNILFFNLRDTKDRWKIKLCDFGLSLPTQFIANYFGSVQTMNYRAPEVLLGLPKCEKVDSWSIGCVIFSLYTGFELFTALDEYEMLRQIKLVTGLPDGYEQLVLVDKHFKTDKKGIETLRDDSNTNTCEMKYAMRGFDDLHKLGDNYLTTGTNTQMDKSIVRLISSLLQPTSSMRINASKAYNFLKLLMQDNSQPRTFG